MSIQKYYNIAVENPDIYENGLNWYWEAHNMAVSIAHYYSISMETMCGIIAALSPQNRWPNNLVDAEKFIRSNGNCKVSTFGANKAKALKILQGEYPLDILKGDKVINFYHCLLRPDNTTFVCVDRHAFRVAYSQEVNEESNKLYAKVIKRIKGYELIAEEYRKFAEKVGLRANQVQAITWEAYRIHNKTKGR